MTTSTARDELIAHAEQGNQLAAEIAHELGTVTAQRDQLVRLVNEIPACYPDGTGILAPAQWVQWAKSKLGYAAQPPRSEA